MNIINAGVTGFATPSLAFENLTLRTGLQTPSGFRCSSDFRERNFALTFIPVDMPRFNRRNFALVNYFKLTEHNFAPSDYFANYLTPLLLMAMIHPLPQMAAGFGSPLIPGAKAMRRKVRGFFYALTVMVGGVWGSREACRILDPVYQPDTSSTALIMVGLAGGYTTSVQEQSMNTPTTPEIRPFVALLHGEIRTTSLKIAEHFGKNHYDVLRSIQNLDCSKEFNDRNFAVVGYYDAKNEFRPMYEMTRDGFTFLVMGFTGKEAAKWKEAYINAFNELERALNAKQDAQTRIRKSANQQKLRQAVINRHAHTLMMAQYTAIKLEIERAIRKQPGMTAEQEEAFILSLEIRGLDMQSRRVS